MSKNLCRGKKFCSRQRSRPADIPGRMPIVDSLAHEYCSCRKRAKRPSVSSPLLQRHHGESGSNRFSSPRGHLIVTSIWTGIARPFKQSSVHLSFNKRPFANCIPNHVLLFRMPLQDGSLHRKWYNDQHQDVRRTGPQPLGHPEVCFGNGNVQSSLLCALKPHPPAGVPRSTRSPTF
jgi:hypothetical protein